MSKINAMDRTSAKLIASLSQKALEVLAAEYGLTVTQSGSTRYDGSMARVKFEFAVPRIKKINRENDAKFLGFSKDIMGEKFVFSGKTFRVVEMKLSRPRYPIVGENERGTRYKFSASTVAHGLLNETIKWAGGPSW